MSSSSSQDEELDGIFSHIAARQRGIEPLLEAFFGFLKRKTDFYMTYPEGMQSHAGFPPGVAEAMVRRAIARHPFTPAPTSNPSSFLRDTHTTSVSFEVKSSKSNPISSTTQYSPSGKLVPVGNGGVGRNGLYYWTQTLVELTVYVDLPLGTKGDNICQIFTPIARANRHPFMSGKDIDCKVAHRRIHISLHSTGKVYLDGTLEESVGADNSVWTVSSDSGITQLILTIEKSRNTWWKYGKKNTNETFCTSVVCSLITPPVPIHVPWSLAVVEGDIEIDTSLVDSTQKVREYDTETQVLFALFKCTIC